MRTLHQPSLIPIAKDLQPIFQLPTSNLESPSLYTHNDLKFSGIVLPCPMSQFPQTSNLPPRLPSRRPLANPEAPASMIPHPTGSRPASALSRPCHSTSHLQPANGHSYPQIDYEQTKKEIIQIQRQDFFYPQINCAFFARELGPSFSFLCSSPFWAPNPTQIAPVKMIPSQLSTFGCLLLFPPSSQHDHKLNRSQLAENKGPDLSQIATKIESQPGGKTGVLGLFGSLPTPHFLALPVPSGAEGPVPPVPSVVEGSGAEGPTRTPQFRDEGRP
jgi:hypothetical protein